MLKKLNTLHYYIIILLTALAVGFFSISLLSGPLVSDELQYNEAAQSLIENKTYPIVDNILLPPGLPFFLAMIFFIFGYNYTAVFFIQFILLGGIGFAVFLISQKYFKLSHAQSFLPAITIIFWPYFIFYATSVLTEVLFSFFVIWSLYFLLEYWQAPSLKNTVTLGIFFGLASLTRPTNLLLLFWLFGFYIIIILIKKDKDLINFYLKKSIIVLSVYVLTLLPWTVYATLKTGVFTPVTSTLEEIYSNDNSTYAYEWNHYKTPGYEPGSEITTNKLLTIKLKNIYRFWKSGANGTQAEEIINKYPQTRPLITAYKIFFFSLLFLFLFSAFAYRKQSVIILWIIILYFWILHIVLHPYPRYTLPIIPLMITLAYYSFFQILENFKKIKNAKFPKTKTL